MSASLGGPDWVSPLKANGSLLMFANLHLSAMAEQFFQKLFSGAHKAPAFSPASADLTGVGSDLQGFWSTG